MDKYCCCQEWQENKRRLIIIECMDIKPFECCPWCGVILKKGKPNEPDRL